nr:hypothetical protein [Candidatus Woesearchaeota archaeon]
MIKDNLYNLFEKIKHNPDKTGFLLFLEEYKQRMHNFLEGKITNKHLSDLAIHFFVIEEQFSDNLENFDNRISDLRKAMDITHPDWSDKKRKEYIKKLIKLADKIIEDHRKD